MYDKRNKNIKGVSKARRHCSDYNYNKNKNKYNSKQNIIIHTNIHIHTWMFNLLAVALLIQHVAGVAPTSEHVSVVAAATTTTSKTTTKAAVTTIKVSTSTEIPTTTFTPTVQLVKRNVESVSANSNNNSEEKKHTRIEFTNRATSRHLSGIEAEVGDGSSTSSASNSNSNAGGDGLDFAAYMNDFNMQAEAAIPEDILDQQHIKDVDGIDADSMQYVSESGAIDGGGEALAEPEADIILAAQKFSTSENSHEPEEIEVGEKYAQLKNSDKSTTGNSRKNVEEENGKLKNQKAYDNNNNNNNTTIENQYKNGNTGNYFDSMDDEMDELNAETSEEPLALPRTSEMKSFQLTTNTKEQQNHKLITEGDRENDEKVGNDVTEQQQLQLIENLAGKFNKAPLQTERIANKTRGKIYQENNNNKYKNLEKNSEKNDDKIYAVAWAFDGQKHNNKSEKDNNITNKQVNNKSEMFEYMDGSNQAEEDTAIGDIEDDKFPNEDKAERELQYEHKISLPGELNNKDISSFEKKEESLASVRKNIGTSEEERDGHGNMQQSSKFIPKKIKRHNKMGGIEANNNNKQIHNIRHHYGEQHKLSGNFANTFTQLPVAEKVEKVAVIRKNQPQQEQQKLQHIDEVIDSNSNGGNEAGSSQADYSITYFGILTNSSKKHEKPFAGEDEDVVRTDKSKEEGNGSIMQRTSENSVKIVDNVEKIADSIEAAKVGVVVHHQTQTQPQQQHHEQQNFDDKDESNTGTHKHSAFEHFKALRRKTRRYGHKMHKKKYKNYLRYVAPPTLTGRQEIDTIKVLKTTTKVPLEIQPEAKLLDGNGSANDSDESNNATQTELTNNNNLRDYYSKQQQQRQMEKAIATRAEKHAEKLRKYAKKIEEEKLRGLPASPIFVVSNRSAGGGSGGDGGGMRYSTTQKDEKPFYEGQINYFLETSDDDENGDSATRSAGMPKEREEHLRSHERSMERMIAADNNNWYRRVSPVFRNGIKMLSSNDGKHDEGGAITPQQQHAHKHPWEQRTPHQYNQHQRKHHHHQRKGIQYNHQREHIAHGYQQHHKMHHHHHRRISSNNFQEHKQQQHNKIQQEKEDEEARNKLLPSAHNPPSPHAADTEAAVKMGMVQTPIPPPAYNKQHEKQAQLDSDALKLGHQITELEEFERYYAKWPHLARVRFQVYDEHYRESHPELYTELKLDGDDADDEDDDENYDDDYESAAELEEAQSGHDEDANLPPYIKKYNRRNKQLLNLLEGTLAPPTRPPITAAERTWSNSLLQPGPHASSRRAGGGGAHSRVRIDDDYLKEKRKRYHNQMHDTVISSINKSKRKEERHHYQDLFAQQRSGLTNETERFETVVVSSYAQDRADKQKAGVATAVDGDAHETIAHATNQLPDEDISVELETVQDIATADRDKDMDAYVADDGDVVDIWQKEIENKSNANELTGNEQMTWQMEKLTTPSNLLQAHHSTPSSTITPRTPKALVFRLPSYPAIAGNFIGKPRSRSAQFAPSGGSRGTLAFVAPANADLHSNRWSNIYGKAGGVDDGGGGSNALGRKSLSRFSPYKASVHKTLTVAAAAAQATNNDNDAASTDNVALKLDDVAMTTTATNTVTSNVVDSWGDIDDGVAEGIHTESGALNVGAPPRTIKSFVYHRVIDASPRLVGTGVTGRKQRLPFVAITDRRLETTKKAQLERQKEFEQNHYPMP
ncbi:uncharacterized protein [Eurosta solidaginis]|uniref:uncharacterized protein n=1 Tax=Eurosta solidaginis TaxID=178769 RepID=UPI00353097B5